MEALTLTQDDERIIGTLPERWLRMDLMSQLAVLEVGRVLRGAGLLDEKNKLTPDKNAALIIGSRYGSLATDMEYANSLSAGVEFASPALFGYTLANIAPAEAASHYGISGPVFALLDTEPLTAARQEAGRWLPSLGPGGLIIYGELDVIPGGDKAAITSSFHILSSPCPTSP